MSIDAQDERCHCGEPLHYSDPELRRLVEDQIAETGHRYVRVTTPDGTFLVDKHYIALHGIRGDQVAQLGFVREG